MRINLVKTLLPALAATALAAPNMGMMNDFPKERDTIAEAIIYAMQGDCNMFNCAAVIAGAACATMGMINQDPGSVLGCMSGGSQAACSCMNCVPNMATFFKDHGICPT
ncbi:hypothetical protein M432DRAFT_426689 [Thermoascus aurantiacus ATCC 26904]